MSAVIISTFALFWAYCLYRQSRRLNALRRNCFITNEKGHRVRYVSASNQARAKAEASN